MEDCAAIHSDFNPRKSRHSRESGNPGKNWIPGQARNDKHDKSYVVTYIMISSRLEVGLIYVCRQNASSGLLSPFHFLKITQRGGVRAEIARESPSEIFSKYPLEPRRRH